ncbi:MAG: acyltransferase [Bradyrhizobium sp.]|nr:acyltransferase [Bradyrhizobium sp.]
MEVKASSGFLPRLESLRGVAAVSVVGYHAVAIYWDVAATGMIAVVVFFVLSGFVLARSLEQNPSAAAFFRSRLFRLLPPAAVTVLLFASLYWLFGFWVGFRGDFSFLNVVLNALMMKSDINGVMWSMTVECAATPVILGSFWALGRYGLVPLMAACVILFGLSFWGPYVHLLGGITNLAPLYGFVIGVIASCRGRDLLQQISPRVIQALTFGALILMCFLGTRKQTAPVILLEIMASAWIIASIAFGPPNAVFRPLDFRIVRFYGRISYSFYLLHLLGMAMAVRVLAPFELQPNVTSIVVTTVLAVLFTTPLAWASWRMIEVPSKRFGRSQGKLAGREVGSRLSPS